MEKILIVEAEKDAGLAGALNRAGYTCTYVPSVREALSIAEGEHFNLALLDAERSEGCMPDSISLLRAKGRYPILVISPASGKDKLIGLLNAGAADYLTRPFELQELIARIEILVKRFTSPEFCGILHYRELTLDPATFHVTLHNQPIKLTKQEFKILELMLLSPPGRVYSKQDFYDYAWDCSYMGIDKTINVHICNIRRKFRKITEEPYIETIWGLGFRLA